jgi:hypothetical protein
VRAPLWLALLATGCVSLGGGPGEPLRGELLSWQAPPMSVKACGSGETVPIEVAEVFAEWFTSSARKLAANDPAAPVFVDLRGTRAQASFRVDRVVAIRRGACP